MCNVLERLAEWRCRGGCFPGDTYLCGECEFEAHGRNILHRCDELDEKTLGFKAVRLRPRQFELATCTVCKASFKSLGSSTPVHDRIKNVVVCTATAGPVDVTIVPVTCALCTAIVGETAVEYDMVPGSEAVWFESILIEQQELLYNASKYALTRGAFARALELSNQNRGYTGSSSGISNALACASRFNK